MTLVPAWIREQTNIGAYVVFGSQPEADAPEVLIHADEIVNVSIYPDSPTVMGRKFGILVLRHADCIDTPE